MHGNITNLIFLFVLFVVIFTAETRSAAIDGKSDVYPYSIFLDRDRKLELSWRIDYRRSRVYFMVEADIDSNTWFGVGFSDYGETTDADLAVFWTSNTGVHHFQDAHTDHAGLLFTDKHQDYYLRKAYTQRQITILKFYRKFDTCDDEDYIFDTGTTHVIFFMTSNPLTSLKSVNVTNLSPGLQRVQLLKPEIDEPPLPKDTWTFEVTAPNIEIPAQETTYWWYTAKLPPLRQKHHIIKYEGVVLDGSDNLVHHMEVFHCEVPANEIIRYYNGPGEAEGKPTELASCRKVIGAWAMGAKALSLPEEAGYPIGGPEFSRYVMLEVHYNNPSKLAGKIDASGVRFYVTSELRRYDAGVMELGLEYTNKMVIPPGQKAFPLTGYCIQECTQIGLPSKGIQIFASQLHTHLTGRRVYTKRVRNGMELPELNRDNHYSPHFQEIRSLPVPVQVLPGDALITTCEDRTDDRINATIGGFAITDEMCVNYVHYYPLVNLEVCKSSVSTHALQKFFSFMNRWDLDTTSSHKGDRDNFNSIRWTPLTSLLLKTLYMTSPISMQCNQSDGSRFPGSWNNAARTATYVQLPLETRDCDLTTPTHKFPSQNSHHGRSRTINNRLR